MEAQKKFKIISGGQTGVDQLALEVAHAAGYTTGGTMPRRFATGTGGMGPAQARAYGMVELNCPVRMSLMQQYVLRSKKNVDDCDCVIAFYPTDAVSGTNKTIAYATAKHWSSLEIVGPSGAITTVFRPTFFVSNCLDDAEQCIAGIRAMIEKCNAEVVCVCGPRRISGDQAEFVRKVLGAVLA